MFCQIVAERLGTHAVAVVQDEKGNAEIHQGKCNRVPRAAGAHLHDGCAARALGSKAFLKAVAPSAPVKIVARGASVRGNRDGIDRASLRSLRVDGIQERKISCLNGYVIFVPAKPAVLIASRSCGSRRSRKRSTSIK